MTETAPEAEPPKTQPETEQTVHEIELPDTPPEEYPASETPSETLPDLGDLVEGDVETSPLTALTEERDNLKDQLLRALAEVENIRQRSEREMAQTRKYGHAPFVRDLLGALDNLDRAVEALPIDRDGLDATMLNLVIGIEMVSIEITSVLARHHITRIEPLGAKFDYDRHQAMFEVPTDEAPAGTVVQVARTGWMLHDRLLSPAMVGVAKPLKDSDNKNTDPPADPPAE